MINETDKKSLSLRKAVERQAGAYDCGYVARWVSARKSWVYALVGRLSDVQIVIPEDGSVVFFVCSNRKFDAAAKTPIGVARCFSRLLSART